MEKVRIQDDLYNFVNQEWLDKAIIPDDKPMTGGFANLALDVEKLMINEFNEMLKNDNYPNDYLKKCCKLFEIIKNTKKRKKDGIKPALKRLNTIKNLKSIRGFNNNLTTFIMEGYPLPFNMSLDVDMKDNDKKVLYFQGPDTILPDTTYYKDEMKAQKDAILGVWKNMALTLLGFTKLSEEEKTLYVEDAIKFDAIIASLVKSSEEWSEYAKMYNIVNSSKLKSILKNVKILDSINNIFGFVPENVSFADPRFLKNFKTLFNQENFEAYKHWAYVNELINAGKYLSEELRDISTSFRRALTGIASMPNVEKYAYSLASNVYSEPVGLYYGEKYFGNESKKDVVEMVHEIIDTYKSRVAKNDFLQEDTKKKAIEKLDTIVVKMGYPDKVEEVYDKASFDENASLYEIILSLNKIKKEDEFSKINDKLDRNHWAMPGNMVNACYNPFCNDITFPAAILQVPFYSINQTRSQNLGGIGAVIGHEISHAFDNNGSLFDKKGNMANWWQKEDLKQFNLKTKAMIKEFEGIELPWGKVNSKLIVSENIADNGGMAVTLDIMSRLANKSYEEYFINWAKVWCMKGKEQYLQLLLKVDVHAPTILRANMQPRNFNEWYETFNVKKTDKMYIKPSSRVVIW